MKRWRGGDQIERWVASGLLVAERQFPKGDRLSADTNAAFRDGQCRSKEAACEGSSGRVVYELPRVATCNGVPGNLSGILDHSVTRIAILGAGLSGMAAANVLPDQDVVIYEARERAGGHASSFSFDRFTFDEGPHVSFTPDQRIREFFADSVQNEFLEHPSYADNYYHGIFLRHPVQTNLYGMPPEVVRDCLAGFVRAQYEDQRDVRSYLDWCYKQLGTVISETFTRVYTRKYWTRELEDLTTDWVSQRIYAPKLEEVLDGALGCQPKGQHYYMSTFRYPKLGGFEAYSRGLQQGARIRFGQRVAEVDLRRKKLTFANGLTEHYDHLISSLVLPELISMILDAPKPVRDAAAKLACTSHFLVSVGVKRPQISQAYWTYYYDEEIPFSRLSFPSKFSPDTAPEACSSVQAEVVHSRFRPLDGRESIVERCIEWLVKCGVLHSASEVLAVDARDIQYANVIFDFDRAPNLALVHGYLSKEGVYRCGRFGDWAYLWTDQAIRSGERAGNEVRRALGLRETFFDNEARAKAGKT